MATDQNRIVKIGIFAFAILNLLVGLACFACGLWFNASPDIHAYLMIFVKSENDQSMLAAAGIFLAVGILLTLLSLLFGYAFFRSSSRLIVLFISLIWIVFVLGLICGFICVAFRYEMHLYVKKGMLDQLQNLYEFDNKVGRAWNRVQVKKRCCGVDGSWDYRDSAWFSEQNMDLVQQTTFVPVTCCTLNFNQDQWLYWVDPQNPQLKDPLRCQQDAQGYKDGSANLNGLGCFAAMFSKNKDLWHDQSIFTILDVISGLGLTAGFLQIFAVICAFVALDQIRQQRSAQIEKRMAPRY